MLKTAALGSIWWAILKGPQNIVPRGVTCQTKSYGSRCDTCQCHSYYSTGLCYLTLHVYDICCQVSYQKYSVPFVLTPQNQVSIDATVYCIVALLCTKFFNDFNFVMSFRTKSLDDFNSSLFTGDNVIRTAWLNWGSSRGSRHIVRVHTTYMHATS